MALKATIHKAELQISNLDLHYYNTHQLTVAKHPSETEIRLVARLIAFCFHANERLLFTKGLSTQDEPDLWEHADNGDLLRWIELGQPDERRIRQACGRAAEVVIYCYSGSSAEVWWQQNCSGFEGLKNLTIYNLEPNHVEAVATHIKRTIDWQVTIQDSEMWLNDNAITQSISPLCWLKQGEHLGTA